MKTANHEINRRANELARSYINGNTGSVALELEQAGPFAMPLALAVLSILRGMNADSYADTLERRLLGFDPHVLPEEA